MGEAPLSASLACYRKVALELAGASGRSITTSWEANGIYHVVPDQLPKPAIQHVGTPAGISDDTDRQRILIPVPTSNEVLIQPGP